jgi:hypothetical protein
MLVEGLYNYNLLMIISVLPVPNRDRVGRSGTSDTDHDNVPTGDEQLHQ